MSNSPNFFVQGKIDKDTDVYVVAKTTISGTGTSLSPNIFRDSSITNSDTVWSVLGVHQLYTPYTDIEANDYYYYDKNSQSYYYPLTLKPSTAGTIYINFANDSISTTHKPNDDLFFHFKKSTVTPVTLNDIKNTKPPDETYINVEAVMNLPLVVTDTTSGYYYPVFINKHQSTIPIKLTNGTKGFYYDGATAPLNKTAPQDTATPMFFNPYQSIMNNLFRIEQSPNIDQGMSLVLSSSIGNPSIKKFKNIGVGLSNNLTASSTGSSDFFNFEPQGVNVDNKNLYAGVGYKLSLTKNLNSKPNFQIVQKIHKDNSIIEKSGVQYSSSATPNPTSFLASVNPSDISYTLHGTLTFDNTVLYFIPYHTYQVSTNNRREYLGYEPIEMLLSSPQVFNVGPKIWYGSSASGTNYYKWAKQTGMSTDGTELAFTTTSHDSHVGIVYRYCNQNEFCGKCFGYCDATKVTNPILACVLDTESQSKFKDGEDFFTCDHQRYVESSKYVKRGTIQHHSNSLIIVVLIVGIIIIAGIVLFEERKMILKHILHSKNGSGGSA